MGLHPQRTPRLPARQRGMATLMIILLAGLALTVTALGVTHAVRSAQDKQVTVHAATHAQAGAWTGVEVFRQYLKSINQASLEALAAGQAVSISLGDMALGAVIVQNTVTSGSTRRITANIRNQDAAARSTSVIQAVYQVTPGGATNTESGLPWSDVLNIYNDLNMSGGIGIRGYDNANFNVSGNVSLNNASITGIKTIKATGDISIGSAIAVTTLYSNGNIALTGSASATTASALGNITVASGGTQGTLNANGNITLSNGSTSTANALGWIKVSSGSNQGALNAAQTIAISNGGTTNVAAAVGNVSVTGGSVNVINSEGDVTSTRNVAQINANGSVVAGGSAATVIKAIGNVTLNDSGSKSVTTKGSVLVNAGNLSSVTAQQNLTFNGWGSASGRVGGTVTKAEQYNNNVNVSRQPGLVVDVPLVDVVPMTPLTEFSLTQPQVDAYPLKSSANYAFTYDSGHIVVSVANISGIPAGSYRIGKIKTNYNDKWGYLCSDIDGSGYCRTECATVTNGSCSGVGVASARKICQGTWDGAECIAYSNGTWTLNGQSDNTVIAPGVLWLKGNLALQSGFFRNSIIATGNITTSGSDKVSAINYSGYTLTCQNNTFSGLYPVNYCGTDGALIGNPVGNIGLLAGGYINGAYSGGIINLGASTEVFGSVIAGDTLLTSGNSTVHGYVTAAGLGSSTSNDWGGSLTIDLTNLPAGYNPGGIPDMDNCTSNCDGGHGSAAASAELLWSRYL
ncbi:hypothetical protein [Pseudomonas kuykendallii]|uniref:hypothetical protein n=1 Tax=Pseudomonas kuykendallii TaxID=1007099 RepID=UPI0028D47132|nr:hypothetical protein [Pseudomonas kuykendallii]